MVCEPARLSKSVGVHEHEEPEFFATREDLAEAIGRQILPGHVGHDLDPTEPQRFVQPIDSTVALHHLIFGGVLTDYPNLKLVAAHGGGFLPGYSGRIDHAASARPDCCERLHRMPTTYLKRVYFDALVYTHHQLEYLVEEYGADHILMGTDYPADMGEVDPIGMIEGTPTLDDVERRAILGRNAARLLNLEIPAAPR